MNKILVLINKDTINFSIYNRSIDEIDINNTNIIDTKNLKFSEDYINDNADLLSSFLSVLIIKHGVNKAVIKNNEIGETILNLINKIDKITSINFKEDFELNYTVSSLLLDNKYLKKIECYSMPEIMFNRFSDNIVKTRSELLFESEFMKYNNIKTYSELCNKDKIIIDSYLTKSDVDDIIYFFSKNNNLKRVDIKGYKRQNLYTFIKMIREHNKNKIVINLIEDKNVTDDIINDVSIFNKLQKKYNLVIKIKYSKEYKEKNCIKEINLKLFKNILIIIIFLLIISIFFQKQQEVNDNKNIKDNLIEINETINNVVKEENIKLPENPYDYNYDNLYDNLVKMNNDTVGFLQVKKTEINYPIVQAKDNEYYLKHAFDKKKNRAGWVFVDYRNDMENISKNTIIYGHNMRNNIMFGSLKKILDDKWLDDLSNHIIKFNIKGKTYYYKIFSIYISKPTSEYLKTDFNDNEFKEYIQKVKNKSIRNFNVKINDDDKILTLSTCHFQDRLVVHAKMLSN